MSGPFRALSNSWRFLPHEQGSTVAFFVEVEFRSRLLQAVVDANADRVTDKIARSFEARARQLYGAPAAA